MSNVSAKKVFIKIESAAEQQENIKKSRKTLKTLQTVATDKENLAGRPFVDKINRIKSSTEITSAIENAKRKKIDTRATQTSPPQHEKKTVTVEDLTGTDNPSAAYWELLAEKRREALEASLIENQNLHKRIESLEGELNTSRQLLEETKNLVEVLTEMLNENEAEKEIEENQEPHSSGSDSDNKGGDKIIHS